MNTMDVSNKAKNKHHYEFNMEEECWKDKYHIKEESSLLPAVLIISSFFTLGFKSTYIK